jgi:hypothetical protein
MKKLTFTLLFILSFISAKASLSIEGYYQGKNLYIQSSLCGDGFGYCATKVTVNGNVMAAHIQNGAFEIDFSNFHVKLGQAIFIVIEHHDECKPKIINPEVLLPNSTFKIEDINCSSEGFISWVTTAESGKLAYQIEHYKWNKWIVVGEVNGEGVKSFSKYSFTVIPHSGENKIRVSQTDNTGKKRSSKEIVFINNKIKVPRLKTQNDYKSISFMVDDIKVETKYEIYDAFGNILKKGLNSDVDFSNLAKGIYYVNFDNKNEKIIKK